MSVLVTVLEAILTTRAWAGGLHIKGAGMLVVSLRVVNFGFWSHLGCSGLNAIIFSHKRLIQDCTLRNIKKLFIFNLFYFLDSCNQSFKWSFLGVKKRMGHVQIGLL